MLKARKPVVRRRVPRLVGAMMLVAPLVAMNLSFSQTTHHQRSSTMSMKDDLARRSSAIHWPVGFEPSKADLFSHNELFIDATCERVWQHILEAPKWPEWYLNAKDVDILNGADAVLKEGTVFHWTTFGLPIESSINEFVPFSRIGWFGNFPAAKPAFYHTWYLTSRGNGCHVVTEEVGNGPDAINLRTNDEGLMHRAHDLWLASLRWVAEGKLDR